MNCSRLRPLCLAAAAAAALLFAPAAALAKDGVFTTGDEGTRPERKARAAAAQMLRYTSQCDLAELFETLPYSWRQNWNNVLEMLERRITPETGETLRTTLLDLCATIHAQNANAILVLHGDYPGSYVPSEAKWLPSIDELASAFERSIAAAQRGNLHRGNFTRIFKPAKTVLPKDAAPRAVPALRSCENADGSVEIGLADKPDGGTITFVYLENEFVWVPKDLNAWMETSFVRIYRVIAAMKPETPENAQRIDMMLSIVDGQIKKAAASKTPDELKANLQSVLPVILICATLLQQ